MHIIEDAENSHEKDIDNLDILSNEKTTFSALATTQRLIRQACNSGYGSKKSFVLHQDSNHSITVKLPIKGGKESRSNATFPLSLRKSLKFQTTQHQH